MKENQNSTPLLKSGRNNFVEQWMVRANTKDIFLKFFVYFLALNYLYEEDHKKNHSYNNSSEKRTESEKLLSFLKTVYYNQTDSKYSNIANVLVNDEFNVLFSVERNKRENKSLNAQSLKYMLPKRVFEKNEWTDGEPEAVLDDGCVKDINKFKTLVAFYKIYRIRCNLFHGHKQSANPRDIELVEKANELLESFLLACIKDGLGFFNYEEEKQNTSSCDNTYGV